MDKQTLKVRIVDWWNEDNEENFYSSYMVGLLQRKYNVVYSDNPDFIIYGPFGNKHVEYNCVRIFYTGENVRPDFNIADYAISYDYAIFEDRHLRAPLIFYNNYRSKDLQNVLKTRTHLAKNKTKFCGFVASNNFLTDTRDMFFESLSAYKRVDSGGRWKNNIGGNIDDKIEWLKSYKFNICFENGSYPGYLTEKLFDAYMAGCVPIYWGDTSLRCVENGKNANLQNNINNVNKDANSMGGGGIFDTNIPNIPQFLFDYEINPKSFINAHSFPTFKDLIEEIRRIDNDDRAFMEMLQEPIFLSNFDPQKFYNEKVFQFLDYIVSQGSVCARRRGDGTHLRNKEKLASIPCNEQVYLNFIKYCIKHKKTIELVRATLALPRNFFRFVRNR